ncbi:MAG: protein kinase [Pseudomonadota bacterium]
MAKKSPPNFAEGRGPALHSARWRFGAFELDEARRELSRQGELVEIEPKPLNMLMLMLRHPGELITKNDLMEALWTGRIVTESVLSNCVTKLRSVLGDEAGAPRIRNLHGYGYRLEASPELITELLPQAEAPLLQVESGVPFRPHWRLRRRLGLSGETWLAEQPHTGEQRVFKFAHTPRALSALKREVTLYRLLRQTLEDQAQVPDLLDWNFDEPPWFIEAEYCALGSLSDWLEAQGGARALPLETRLGLVIQLAEALGAVHAVGILHKDLKPANVLVSPARNGEVRLKLGDFGSGRLLDSTRLEALAITRLGFSQFVESGSSSTSGTPLYYAPEVLSGQPTTLKADIYALGVIFYQLVVGDLRRLFAPGWEASVEDELIREDIAAAAAGDPYARLPDALLLAQRLRQLPARREERARQKAEREAAAATVLALHKAESRRAGLRIAAGVLAVGLVVSTVLFWQAAKARDAAQRAGEQALASRDFLLRDVLGRLSSGDEPAQRVTVGDLLRTAAEQVGDRFKADPATEAVVRHVLGLALVQLGLREEASREFFAAIEKAHSLTVQSPVAYAGMATSLMTNEYNLNRFQAHATKFAELHAFSRKWLPAHHPDLLSQYRVLALVALDTSRFAEALVLINQAVDTAAAQPDTPLRSTVYLLRIQGRVQLVNGEYSAGVQTLRKALALSREALGAESWATADLMAVLAAALTDVGEYAEARTLLEAAEPMARRWEPVPGELRLLVVERIVENELRAGRPESMRLAMASRAELLRQMPAELANRPSDYNDLLPQIAVAEGRWGDALANRLDCSLPSVSMIDCNIWNDRAIAGEQARVHALVELNRLQEAEARLQQLESGALSTLPAANFLQMQQLVLQARLMRARLRNAEAVRLISEVGQRCEAIFLSTHPQCQQWRALREGLFSHPL